MDAIPRDPATASREAIREQLGRIVSSRAFEGAERSIKLLRYLVEHTLNGQTASLKEYTLGTEVLGKASSFDPRIDTIVRAEASRLRSRLERYYTTEGQSDPFVITLPKGSYVPLVHGRPKTPEKATAPEGRWAVPKRFPWIAGPLVAAACLIVLGVWSFSRAPAPPDTPVSIAVLPFTNLSGDASQEFFSDGVTEEITSALAKVPDLRVVARTSAYEFKGENRNVQSIAQQLHATHLIEGSVRREGNRVRISAQLIRADTGVHVWAQSYDRELNGVFAVQEEIAGAIAGALQMPLGLKPGEQLVSNRAIDAESYLQYLRAKTMLIRNRGGAPEALKILEPIVARNPSYAPAWAQLARAYVGMTIPRPNSSAEEQRRLNETYEPKIEAAARRVLALDPNSVDGLMMEAGSQSWAGRLALAEDLSSKALALDPGNPEVLVSYSALLLILGRVKESLAMKQQLQAFEPHVPTYNMNLANTLWINGDNDAAIALLNDRIALQPEGGAFTLELARVYASLGRYTEAADILSRAPARLYNLEVVAAATRLLRSAPANAASAEALPSLGELGFVYLHIGAPERAVEHYEQGFAGSRNIGALWHPSYAPVRKMERFKAVVRKMGLVDYWRERGWPPFCHPTTADDFACD